MRQKQRCASPAFAACRSSSDLSRLNGSEGVGGSGMLPASLLLKCKDAEQRGGRNAQALGLMGGFAELEMRLRNLDVQVLRSSTLSHFFTLSSKSFAYPPTSGLITATAVSSIDKFITSSILSHLLPSLAAAMSQLSSAGTHCKFEASDLVSNKVVLRKSLDVLRNHLTGRLGQVLSNESLCNMAEMGPSLCCQMRLSKMLRQSAKRIMQFMVATVFTRLRHVPSDDELGATQSEAMATSVSLSEFAADVSAPGGPRMAALDPRSVQVPAAGPSEREKSRRTFNFKDDGASNDDGDIAPFGLASIQELLRVIIALFNPHDQQHTLRLMALCLVNITCEVGGRSIRRFPVSRMMVADHLCRHLLQLARCNHPQLLSTSLRAITNIFSTMRRISSSSKNPSSRSCSTASSCPTPLDLDAQQRAALLGNFQASARERSESTRGGPSAESRELMLENLDSSVT
ncbi:hypothetical protein Rhopal_001822-T1 [Rhodotorula paludigena]|uniref:Uncharacterized protein n=1 Tax=Rhodotorula paludigena TaxID=86838 RepID=A0AAV5G8E1_9BASI|nr:hypothetical protein Rhopal_001822-T1 [Rhodotorula paludigena]